MDGRDHAILKIKKGLEHYLFTETFHDLSLFADDASDFL